MQDQSRQVGANSLACRFLLPVKKAKFEIMMWMEGLESNVLENSPEAVVLREAANKYDEMVSLQEANERVEEMFDSNLVRHRVTLDALEDDLFEEFLLIYSQFSKIPADKNAQQRAFIKFLKNV